MRKIAKPNIKIFYYFLLIYSSILVILIKCTDITNCYDTRKYFAAGDNECKYTTCSAMNRPKQRKMTQSDGFQIIRCSYDCLGGEYYHYIEGIIYCEGDEPSTTYYYYDSNNNKVYTDSCPNDYIYKNGNQCVKECEQHILDNKCVPTCIGTNKPYHKEGKKTCLYSCDNSITYTDEENFICVTSLCPSSFIDPNTKKCIPKTSSGDCFEVKDNAYKDSNGNRYCITTGCPIGYFRSDSTSHTCLSSCQSPNPCHEYQKFICLPNCDGYTYTDNNICYNTCPEYFIVENGIKICKTKDQCYNSVYKYKKGINGIECVQCLDNFKVPPKTESGIKILGICLETREECANAGYKFYNIGTKQCQDTQCPSGMKPNYDSNNNLAENDAGNTCTSTCSLPYDKETLSHYCKKKCDPGEYFSDSDPHKCLPSCDTEYIGNDNKCLNDCNDFYYLDSNNKKRCTDECPPGKPFFFINDNQCYANCCKSNNCKYYYNTTTHQCFTSCIDNDGANFAEEATSTIPKPCRPTNDNKYYYEDKKILLDECYLASSKDSHICVNHCAAGEKVYDNQCKEECPEGAPYIIESKQKISASDYIDVNKCVVSCKDTDPDYKKIIKYNMTCAKNCPDNSYESNNEGICIVNCLGLNKYYDENKNECVSQCSTPYKEKSGTFYICKSVCTGTNKYIDKGECIGTCPEDFNKIGEGGQCKDNCLSDNNGKFFIEKFPEVVGRDYVIYKCSTCPNDDGEFKFYIKGDYQCYKECPTGNEYVIEGSDGGYECLLRCPVDKPYYDKNNKLDNKYYICKANLDFCTNDKKYYFDGECLNENGCKGKNKNYIEGNFCVSQCSQSFQYKKKTTVEGVYFCKDNCGDDYIESNEFCVESCSNNNFNYIGNKRNCRAECSGDDGSNYYLYDNTNGIYQCTDGCPKDYPYRTLNTNECYKECPSNYPYLSIEENTCFDNCQFSKINNKFSLTYIKDSKTYSICVDNCINGKFCYMSGGEEKCIEYDKPCYRDDKTCIKCSDCPSNAKKKDHDGKCVSNCDLESAFKFENDNSCVDACPPDKQRYSTVDYKCKQYCEEPNNIVYGNECRSECEMFLMPITVINSIVTEYECTTFCGGEGDFSDFQYYYEEDRKCRKSCDKYYIEYNKKCVDKCDKSTDYKFLNGDVCKTCCDTPNLRYSENDYICKSKCEEPNNIVFQNVCLLECPNKQMFLKPLTFDNGQLNGEYECVNSCDPGKYYYEGDRICRDNCNNNIQDEHNGKCVLECDKSSDYKFNEDNKCKISCSQKLRYSKDDYICKEVCSGANVYLTETGNECLSDCQPTEYKKVYNSDDTTSTTITYKGEIRCLVHLGENEYYYKADRIILSECKGKDYYVEDTRECVSNCDSISTSEQKYHYYEKENPSDATLTFQHNACVKKCPNDKPFLNETNNHCIKDCDLSLENDYNCLEKCPNGYYQKGKKCVKCNGENEYLNGNICQDFCPENKNYIIENSEVKTCMIDCTEESPFFTKVNILTDSHIINKCTGGCLNKYKVNKDPTINAKECLTNGQDCPKYINGENQNECYEICPEEKKYDESNKCYSECPLGYFHIIDAFKCMKPEKCNKKTADLERKICVDKCDTQYESKIKGDDNEIATICLKECNSRIYGNFSTPDNKCVLDCTKYETIKNLVNDLQNGKCVCNKDYYIKNEYSYECVEKCPSNLNFIGKYSQCQVKCEKEDGLYYYQINKETETTDGYAIYKCIDNCQDNFSYRNIKTNECFKSCPDDYPYLSVVENTCFDNCLLSSINKFFFDNGASKNCVYECEGDYPHYNEGNYCIKSCESPTYITDYDGKKCVSKCTDSLYKFEENNNCVRVCSDDNKRYSANDYKCKPNCLYPENKVFNNECREFCENDQRFLMPLKDGEYECVSSCGDKYYYEADRICFDHCNKTETKEDYIVEDTHECVEDCDSISTEEREYHFYEPSESGPKYSANTCVKRCPNDKKFLLENNHCDNNCTLTYQYYLENNYKCMAFCPERFNKEGNKCVSDCVGKNEYLDKENCVPICPPIRKYFLKTGDVKECLPDCTEENPYSYEREMENKEIRYECLGYCNYSFIVNTNPNIIAKECLENKKTCLDENLFADGNNKNQCYYKCPENKYEYIYEENGVPKSKQCLDECPLYYYHEKDSFKCINPEDCANKTADFDSQLCVPKCEETKIIAVAIDSSGNNYNICVNHCNSDKSNKYGKYLTPDNKCVVDCEKYSNDLHLDTTYAKCVCNDFNYFDEKIVKCAKDCPIERNFIGTNNTCKVKCEEVDGLNYYKYGKGVDNNKADDESKEYPIYKCLKSCMDGPNGYILKSLEKKECYNKCPDEFPFLSESMEYTCLDFSQCTITYNNYILENDGDGINRCVSKCRSPKKNYWEKNHTCFNGCETIKGYEIEDNDFQCVSKCTHDSFRFEEDNKCVHECQTKKRYSLDDYKCKEKCQAPNNIVEGNECRSKCEISSYFLMPIIIDGKKTGEYECLATCGNGEFKYYYETNRTCLTKCDEKDYAIETTYMCIRDCKSKSLDKVYYFYNTTNDDDDKYKVNTCVTKCPDNKPFAYGQYNETCVDICPKDKRYFINKINEYTTDVQKICLPDCPANYPFYIIEDKGQRDYYYNCTEKCNNNGFYIMNPNSNGNAKLCIGTCPPPQEAIYDDYSKYKYIIDEGNNETCYEICPDEKLFHRPEAGSSCLEKCPSESPYKESGGVICKREEECNGTFIDYEIRTCLPDNTEKCPDSKKSTKYLDKKNRILTICSYSCTKEYGKYSTPYNTCVVDCEKESDRFLNDRPNLKCICRGLYYIDELTQVMTCLDTKVTSCRDSGEDYPIKEDQTNQCLKECKRDYGILSPTGDICYNLTYECPSNQTRHEVDDIIQCFCSYKFFYDHNNKQIRCLDNETSVCPQDYQKYIPATMECLLTNQSCPKAYPKLFQNKFCLLECPPGSKLLEDNITCECIDKEKLWFEISPRGDYQCANGTCPDEYPVFVGETKQCLKQCKYSDYPIIYNKRCYPNCDFIKNTKIIEINSPLGFKTCKCEDPWYIDEEDKMICPKNGTITKCLQYKIGKDYMNSQTKECVSGCRTSEFHYYFERGASNKTFYYQFNRICYESCEQGNDDYKLNIEYDGSSYKCKCQNLWHISDPVDQEIECFAKTVTDCPANDNSLIYLNELTKECVGNYTQCPNDTYLFNHVCREKCPQYTIETVLDDTYLCICNLRDGFWYDYIINGITYYKCGLSECPRNNTSSYNYSEYIRPNLIENIKKCVQSCKYDPNKEFMYGLRYFCIKECPVKTYIDYNNDCRFYDLNDEGNITNAQLLKDAANVQAKELYENSDLLGGFLFNKYGVSLQIYAIDRANSLKDVAMKANLSYIDFDTCVTKLFEDNNLSDNDRIIVAKYDITPSYYEYINNITGGNNTNITEENKEAQTDTQITEIENSYKYLINKVEYELFSSVLNKKIDASVCDPYELLISYPIFFNKMRYDNYVGSTSQNEFKLLFELGKELNKKNPIIDTFNYNNTVYKDLCLAVEINGKDLILEDRYKNLYPNNVLLCESNCTFNHTEFELERIVCSCTYKQIFDFNRKEIVRNDILNDENFILTKQSPANGEVIKCLTKVSIVKNIAFYYCAAMAAAQIAMLFVSAIYGMKSLSSNLITLLGKVNNLDKGNNLKMENNRLKTENEIIPTTQRALNNPPKKNNSEKSDEENEGNIEFNKNIAFNGNKLFDLDLSKTDINNRNISEYSQNSKNDDNAEGKKAEYIPQEYNFMYFKLNDQGKRKKIERSKLPFEVNPDTKILLQRKPGVVYEPEYINGPYFPNQNLIEIVDFATNSESQEDNKEINKEDTKEDYKEDYNEDSKVISKEDSKEEKKEDNNRVTKYSRKELVKQINNINFSNNNLLSNSNNSDEKIRKTIVSKKSRRINNNPKNSNKASEKDYITIKKVMPKIKFTKDDKIKIDDFKEEEEVKVTENSSLLTLIKREQSHLRISFEKYIRKSHPNVFTIFMAEILDKIYLARIGLFLKTFEIFSVHLSLYLFYHLLLVTILCGFFTINTIRKIWERNNFPNINFYLLYGFLANLIVWAIYKMFLIILDIQDKVKDLLKSKNCFAKENNNINNEENNNQIVNAEKIKKDFAEILKRMKIKIAVLYIVVIPITILCFIYLVSFFGIYTGTKNRVLEAYYISIIEIILIKIVYGICLASLRIAAEGNTLKWLYFAVYICDKYLS